jgi:hypothetical protein
LVLPVQRIPRYELLIKELIKNTNHAFLALDCDDIDYSNELPQLYTALQKVKEVCIAVNDAKRHVDEAQRVIQVRDSIERLLPTQQLIVPGLYYFFNFIYAFICKGRRYVFECQGDHIQTVIIPPSSPKRKPSDLLHVLTSPFDFATSSTSSPFTPFSKLEQKNIQLFVFTDTLFFAVENEGKRTFGELYPIVFYAGDYSKEETNIQNNINYNKNNKKNNNTDNSNQNSPYTYTIAFHVPPGYSSVISPSTTTLQSFYHVTYEEEKMGYFTVKLYFTFDDISFVTELKRLDDCVERRFYYYLFVLDVYSKFIMS